MEINEIVILLTTISGVMVTIAGVFLGYTKTQDKAARAEREAAAKIAKEEREEHSRILAKSLDMLGANLKENTNSNKLIATETKHAAREAKERNGHLGEQNECLGKQMIETQKLVLKSQEMIDRNFVEYKKLNLCEVSDIRDNNTILKELQE